MKRFAKLLVVLAFVPAVLAHDVVHTSKIVIDTDMGIDDAVTLALALQNPDTQIVSIVACEGAAGREKCVENLERMLVLFNRGDIKLYAPAEASDPPPPPAVSAVRRASRFGCAERSGRAVPSPVLAGGLYM